MHWYCYTKGISHLVSKKIVGVTNGAQEGMPLHVIIPRGHVSPCYLLDISSISGNWNTMIISLVNADQNTPQVFCKKIV